ncbi:hypothetical protein FGB62_55g138 [Gracilaria domingensis]|nr:hypothetical protein FGB62_55g138 [Gracilaria domingensis]
MAFIAPIFNSFLSTRTGSYAFSQPSSIRRSRRARTSAVISCSATNPAETEPPADIQQTFAPPPSTFYQAIKQAQQAVTEAIKAGFRIIEVEFPPLPAAQLESSAVGAYDVSDANLRLAIDFSSKFAAEGKQVAIAFPDLIEKDRAVELNNESEEPIENVRFSAVKDSKKGAFLERLWVKPELEIAVRDEDDMFVVLGASCQELPDVERLVNDVGERPVILFNLKLDTARGDLGLPAFPRKDLHFRFLSKALPVYYLRTRTYSRSMTRPPYVVNFSGALYKVFPGPYQVLLDTSAGNYERLTTLEERPPLGQVRDILTDGLKIEGVAGKDASFLSKGYKSMTWWEEDRSKAVSQNWRL